MNQEKLYHLFEKSSDAIVIFDTSYDIQYANPSALQLLSYEKNDIRHQPFSRLFSTAFQAELDAFVTSSQKCLHGLQKQIHENHEASISITADVDIQRISRLQKAPAVYLATLYPKHNTSPTHPLKYTEQNIQAETRQLLHLLKDETNVPLGTLSTLVDRLLSMHPRTDQLPILQSMRHSGQRLQKAIEHILLYDDLIHGRMQPDPQPFSVKEIIEAMENTFNTYAKTQGLALRSEIDRALPQFLKGDVRLIRKSLTILFEALAEACTESNSTISLSITHDEIDEHTEKLSFVFETVLDKNPLDKTALGLGIVNHIASLIGTNWYIDKHASKQKRLYFTIPLAIPEGMQTNESKEVPPPSDQLQEYSSLHGLRMLFVEDVVTNHFLMEGLCSLWQIHLDTALNGREALDKLHHHNYDVVLMDLKMPVMNGYLASQIIRQAGSLFDASVPIIALSGSVSDETLDQIKAYGMNDYILKPIDPDLLYQKLISYAST
ncbi:CheY-like chemotaxis protein [Catalinimonas alkaloidigena]|uniref:response regulator n=1 Tax=Catalinimonas alkaloidigena TaxID=1075417 RepID=UPI002404E899|nr:response regulator [Catalinimonas alkaloidigena]MDF9800717.1 CheY-like chemotaxis protein [Catalinimonas alkaloidigena]